MPQIAQDKILELDVRPILQAGGEPFGEIIQAIQNVPENGALRLKATFEPVPLFHFLGAQGWQHEVESSSDDTWVILFYRQ